MSCGKELKAVQMFTTEDLGHDNALQPSFVSLLSALLDLLPLQVLVRVYKSHILGTIRAKLVIIHLL